MTRYLHLVLHHDLNIANLHTTTWVCLTILAVAVVTSAELIFRQAARGFAALNSTFLLNAIRALRLGWKPFKALVQVLIVQAPLYDLSIVQKISFEHVLFMTFLASEAALKAGKHLGMLFDLHLDLFVSGFEDLKGLTSDPQHIALRPWANSHTLGVVWSILLAVGVFEDR